MVTETITVSWACDHCGKSFNTENEADICEKVHEDGVLRKVYMHEDKTVSEFMDSYELKRDDANLVKSMIYEIELLIKIKDNTAEIIGIDGCYIDKDKLYKPSDFE